MIRRPVPVLVLLAASLLLASCGSSSSTVRGKVHFNGKPVSGAEVRFGPNMGEAVTETNYDGRYEITATHKSADRLELKVLKVGYVHDKIEFPAYSAGGTREYDIELKQVFAPAR